MIVSESLTSNFKPCPPGSYLARCCRLIDLGSQTSDFQGEIKTARKVLLAFEVLDDETRRDDGEPYVLSKRYTLSLHEKAALRKELTGWRGRDFTPEELKGFDLKNVLGQLAFISVVESVKGDRTYANIGSIMKPPKGLKPTSPASEPPLHWDMSKPDWQVFAVLHQRLQAQIEASPEFKGLKQPATDATAPAPAPAAGSGFDDLSDDIPF
jgi:hypothetical protein